MRGSGGSRVVSESEYLSYAVRRDTAISCALSMLSVRAIHRVDVADDRLIRARRIFRGDLPRLVKIPSRPSPRSIQ